MGSSPGKQQQALSGPHLQQGEDVPPEARAAAAPGPLARAVLASLEAGRQADRLPPGGARNGGPGRGGPHAPVRGRRVVELPEGDSLLLALLLLLLKKPIVAGRLLLLVLLLLLLPLLLP